MKPNLPIRWICALCAICLMLTPAFASEEPDASEEPQALEAFVTEKETPEDGDPMAARMELQLDGGTKTFSDFTPRALNNEILRRGIDVSAWQGSIDWEKVAADGIEFAFIRAAYRTTGLGTLYKDSCFEANMKGARAAGVKIGVYIFSQAITVEEAVEEADYLMNLVKNYKIDLPLVFDFEYMPNGRLTGDLGKRLSTDICLAFCARVEAAGYESMVYANPSTLNGYLYPEEFGRVWLAHYTAKTSYTGRYEYWQFTASGVVNGIEGDVDLNICFKNYAQK